ncbi:MAG: hypothetical protein ACI81G_001494, partial [Gammaproteobacteria bacterium]
LRRFKFFRTRFVFNFERRAFLLSVVVESSETLIVWYKTSLRWSLSIKKERVNYVFIDKRRIFVDQEHSTIIDD